MKAKTDWKTIAQPWILGCLFPLSWRTKRKIIFKKRLSAETSLIPEDGLFCPNQQPRPFKLNPRWGHVYYSQWKAFSAISSCFSSVSHLGLSFSISTIQHTGHGMRQVLVGLQHPGSSIASSWMLKNEWSGWAGTKGWKISGATPWLFLLLLHWISFAQVPFSVWNCHSCFYWQCIAE